MKDQKWRWWVQGLIIVIIAVSGGSWSVSGCGLIHMRLGQKQ
ncbi:hypothetical protein [Lactiplantibacillus carotarum]|nr:hypothetical protein [Lactiplantibacillus carotarum]